jgi:hypothetical protein
LYFIPISCIILTVLKGQEYNRGVCVSDSNNVAPIVTTVTGAAILPFTGGNVVVSFVVLTAVACAVIVLGVKLTKKLVLRG